MSCKNSKRKYENLKDIKKTSFECLAKKASCCDDKGHSKEQESSSREACDINPSEAQPTQKIEHHDGVSSGNNSSDSDSNSNSSSSSDISSSSDSDSTTDGDGNNKESPSRQSVSKTSDSEDKFYSNKKGIALFFNYIEGCNRDVIDLKKRLSDLGWRCKDMEVKTMEDFKKEYKNEKEIASGTVIVFFFGYGYESQMFLGSSKEVSVSFLVFCQKLSKFRKKDHAMILFSNTCFKRPESDTYEYFVLKKCVNDVFHLCTKINGTCDQGSLMTHILLNEMEYSLSEFTEVARKLCMNINKKRQWNGGEYYSDWRCYGVIKDIYVPPFNTRGRPE